MGAGYRPGTGMLSIPLWNSLHVNDQLLFAVRVHKSISYMSSVLIGGSHLFRKHPWSEEIISRGKIPSAMFLPPLPVTPRFLRPRKWAMLIIDWFLPSPTFQCLYHLSRFLPPRSRFRAVLWSTRSRFKFEGELDDEVGTICKKIADHLKRY